MAPDRSGSALAAKAIQVNLELPLGYFRVHELGLVNLRPWWFIEGRPVAALYDAIKERFPSRHVLPFARRGDCDDVACFVVEESGHVPGEVVVVHDYAIPGTEVVSRAPDFWQWFRSAVDDMIRRSGSAASDIRES